MRCITVAGGEVISDEELSGAEGRSWNAGQNNPAPAKPSDGSGHETMKIEFHRGENEPGNGLSEVVAPDGANVKLYLRPEAELSNADIEFSDRGDR